MSESRFMKTVLFGGYDRAGVEQTFERLSAQLFQLQNEVADQRRLLADLQQGGNEADALHNVLMEQRTKLSQIQAQQETINTKLQAAEAEKKEKDAEIESLKNKIISLKDILHEKEMKLSAFEADEDTKPARAAIAEIEERAHNILHAARKDADELEENSRKLSENIITEANNTVQRIIYEAETQSAQILANAQNRCSETEVATGNLRSYLVADVDRLTAQIEQIRRTFEMLHAQSAQSISNAAQLLSTTDQILKTGGTPVYQAPVTVQPQLPPEPEYEPVTHAYFGAEPEPVEAEAPAEEAPAAAPEPAVSQAAASQNAELERLQQMANAIAGIGVKKPAPQPAVHAPAKPAASQGFSGVPDLAALAAQADALTGGKK